VAGGPDPGHAAQSISSPRVRGFSPAVDGNLARSASAADHANPRAARRRLRRAQLLLAHRLADGSQVPCDAHAGTASGHDRDRLLRGFAIHQTFERARRNHRRSGCDHRTLTRKG